ncbi:MAG: tape measure protein [Magnetococcus sp. WYHC-3]
MAFHDLYVKLGLQSDEYIKGINKAKDKTSEFEKSVGSLKRTAVAAFAAMGVANLAKEFLDAGIQADRLTRSMAAATGGNKQAAEAITFLKQESERLGLVFMDQVDSYKQLTAAARGTAIQGETLKEVYLSLAEASTALQLRADQTNNAIYAVQQMMSKGTVTSEELRRQLGDQLPGAFQIAARAMGVTTQELGKMMDKGELVAEVFLPRFAAQLRKEFGGGVKEAAESAQANLNRLENAWMDFKIAVMQEGLLDVAVVGINALTAALKGLKMGIDPVVEGFKMWGIAFYELNKMISELIGMQHLLKPLASDEALNEILQGQGITPKYKIGEQTPGYSLYKGGGKPAAGAPALGGAKFDLKDFEKTFEQRWKGYNEQMAAIGELAIMDQQFRDDEIERINRLSEKEIEHFNLVKNEKTALDLALMNSSNVLMEMEQANRMREMEQLVSSTDYKKALAQDEHDHALRLIEIRTDEMIESDRKIAENKAKYYDFMAKSTRGFFAIMANEGETWFEVFKAIEIAEAIISTIRSGVLAFEWGLETFKGPYAYAAAVAAAAAAAAFGMARVYQIMSTSPGSGSAAVSGGGAMPTYSAAPNTGIPDEQDQRTTLTINIEGDFIGDEAYIEMLAEKISEAVEDKNVRLVASDAKYAGGLR